MIVSAVLRPCLQVRMYVHSFVYACKQANLIAKIWDTVVKLKFLTL